MSIYTKLFGESNASGDLKKTPWIVLEHLSELEILKKESEEQPVVIFKHSTRCSISRMALKQFESEYAVKQEKLKFYFLDLLAHKTISNEIENQYQVVHESPQILLIKNGICVYHASHEDIRFSSLTKFI